MIKDRVLFALRNPAGLKQERRQSRWWAAQYIDHSYELLQMLVDEGKDTDGKILEFLNEYK